MVPDFVLFFSCVFVSTNTLVSVCFCFLQSSSLSAFALFPLPLTLCVLLDTSTQQDWCYLNEDGELGLAYQGLKQVARSLFVCFLLFCSLSRTFSSFSNQINNSLLLTWVYRGFPHRAHDSLLLHPVCEIQSLRVRKQKNYAHYSLFVCIVEFICILKGEKQNLTVNLM